MSGGFGEAASGQVHFAEISTPILEKVIQFVYYKVRRRGLTWPGKKSADGWEQLVSSGRTVRVHVHTVVG